MSHRADRGKWRPEAGAEQRRHSLEQMRAAIIDCLVEARGGTHDDQSRYLEDVLARAGVDGVPEWPDLYRSLTILQQDALEEGAEARVVQEHVTRLHRILEQVEE